MLTKCYVDREERVGGSCGRKLRRIGEGSCHVRGDDCPLSSSMGPKQSHSVERRSQMYLILLMSKDGKMLMVLLKLLVTQRNGT